MKHKEAYFELEDLPEISEEEFVEFVAKIESCIGHKLLEQEIEDLKSLVGYYNGETPQWRTLLEGD